MQPVSGGSSYGYLYDADGNRVAKGTVTPSSSPLTTPISCDPGVNGFTLTETYILGLGGRQMTTLGPTGKPVRNHVYAGSQLIGTYDSVGLHFQVIDPLGTRHVQTNSIAWPEEQFTNLPFRDGMTASPAPNPPPDTAEDSTPLHFTGKERDAESGNDYFGARYYASTMGRFTSPDPSQLYFADPSNPQSLNLYNYVQNNPWT